MKQEKINIIRIITPPVASNDIDTDLVELTRFLSEKFGLESSYGLGGENGYGVKYENDVFMMHPFCWCEKDDCEWCRGCAPNFWHKKSNFKVNWYKWIGRDSEYNKKISSKEWKEIYEDCIKSIRIS